MAEEEPPHANPPPGWYPDGTGATRWWDGRQWTAQMGAASGPAEPVTPVHCTNCGASMAPTAPVCARCGFGVGTIVNFCRTCGTAASPGQAMCISCGSSLQSVRTDQKEKLVAGLLAILLGGFGVHKFYLGYNTAGVIMILLLFCGISPIIGIIEGIIYLTKSDAEFEQIYVRNEKEWF